MPKYKWLISYGAKLAGGGVDMRQSPLVFRNPRFFEIPESFRHSSLLEKRFFSKKLRDENMIFSAYLSHFGMTHDLNISAM
jgi:hypothetical protein